MRAGAVVLEVDIQAFFDSLDHGHLRSFLDLRVRDGVIWVVQRKTARGRFNRALKRVGAWCREHRHYVIREQHAYLCRALRGHYGYYGLPGNSRSIATFAYRVVLVWLKWLKRRSQRPMTRERLLALLKRFPLPPPRIARWSS
jgi:hypothetical protein